MCLLIGAVGVGKTLLLKRLQMLATNGNVHFTEVPSTVPTVGTNLSTLNMDKKKELTVRELGGAMAPIWPTYLSDSSVLIFMVDASNPAQVSASTILLLTTLASEHLQNAAVLVLLNKIDLSSSLQISELKYTMQLEELLQNSKHNITVQECSVKDGMGLKEVIQWIGENAKGSSSSGA